LTPLLAINGLKKRFGEHTLLDIGEFTINPASAYVLAGPNGAGKTTLLRILSGLEPAEIANAAFLGQSVSFSPYSRILRNEIVYVHQHPIMFSTTVAENIAYGLHARGISKAELDASVEESMEWAGVTHLRDRGTNTLSGGEKQRIAIARARILKPRLLLLDEPTSNLDGNAKEQVIELIPTLVREGRSVLIASHDADLIELPDLEKMALDKGRIECC